MISYAAREVFTNQEQLLRLGVEGWLRKLSHDADPEGEVRCHELVRAVAIILGWDAKKRVADGWYGMVEHSWLWTQDREKYSAPPNILDVYAVGRLPQVQLIHSTTNLPFEYRRGAIRTDIRRSVVKRLVLAMRSPG